MSDKQTTHIDRVEILAVLTLLLYFSLISFYYGKQQGKDQQNKWWINRVTAREFPAGSYQSARDSDVYCVEIVEYKEGFTVMPVKRGSK